MRKLITWLMAAGIAALLLLGGCAPKVGGSDYGSSNAGSIQNVSYGTVVDVRTVRINDDRGVNQTLGTVGGGVAGGVLGNLIGGGSGRTIATVGGAILGAAAGYAGSEMLGNQDGYEITVELDSGGSVAVTQGADIAFTPGQRVKVLSGGGGPARVVPY